MLTAKIDLRRHLQKIRHLPRQADQIMREAVEVDARGFVRDIVAVTPPSQGKANKESQRRGETAVARDVRKVYATPGDLYALIKARNPARAGAFWKLVKARDWDGANRLARAENLPEMDSAVLDGQNGRAEEHARRSRGGRVRGDVPSAAVTQDRLRARYVKQMQKRVGLLASGFAAAARRLGVRLPAWIARHGETLGVVRVKEGFGSFYIEIANKARHGRGNDLARRIAFVLESDKRAKRLVNAVRHRVRALLKSGRVSV